jgi:hypothetical protein
MVRGRNRPDDAAALHHKDHAFGHPDIVERIAMLCNDVRAEASIINPHAAGMSPR